jgi:flagellar hook-basal body complex protein FliE
MMQGLFAVSRIGSQFPATETTAVQPTGIPSGASFAEELTTRINQTIGRLEAAENLSVQAIRGEVDAREVADAVMSAEQSLQAALAIRDKIVQAYLEMSRMQI